MTPYTLILLTRKNSYAPLGDRAAFLTLLFNPGDCRPGYNAQVCDLDKHPTGAVIEIILDYHASSQPNFRAVRDRLW